MKKLIKFLFGLVVLFFVVVVAGVVILPMVISPNDYKPQIIQIVKQETGRDLVIDGDIGLSVFPKIGLTLGRTELSNAPGFGQQVFARIDAIDIQVALMPLLNKQVEMDEVVLQGLSLNLHRKKDGSNNWDDLVGRSEDRSKKKKAGGKKPLELAALVIGGVRIEEAQIHWQDDQAGKQYRVQHFNLSSGPIVAGEPVDFELSSEFSSNQPKMSGQVKLTSTVRVDISSKQFSLSTMKLGITVAGEALPGGSVQADINADQISIDLTKQTLSVTGLVTRLAGVSIKSAMTGQSILTDKLQLNGHVEMPTFNARELLTNLGQPVPETADVSALTQLGVGFDFNVSMNQAKLSKLKVRLDNTNMGGHLSVNNFSNPAIGFDLDIDQIDLDRYLPAAKQNKARATQSAKSSDAEAELFPVETLRQLNLNGEARIGQIKRNNIRASDVVIKIKANGGNINIRPSARLYEGNYHADVTIDARQSTPHLKVDAKLNGVQIEPLLKDLQGKAKLAGQTNADINIYAVGNTQSAVKKTLNGNVRFSFTNGALVGVNIARVIREGWAKLKGRPVSATGERNQTDFSELSGTARIVNGVISNKDLSMKSPLLRLTGAGKVNLVTEELDYLIRASIVGTLQGQGGDDLSKLKGVTIPVRVTGSFDKPVYRPDLSAALSSKVKQKVEEKKEKVKQDFKDKLMQKFKGLF